MSLSIVVEGFHVPSRFPSISGFRVSWDSRKEPGNRVLGVWLLKPAPESATEGPVQYIEEPVKRETGGRTYRIISREYMVQGHDGFTALTKGKILIEDECGEMLSTIVRKYMLGGYCPFFAAPSHLQQGVGSRFVNKMIRLKNEHQANYLHKNTLPTILQLEKELKERDRSSLPAGKLWKHAASLALHKERSKAYYQGHLKICSTEHMSSVDPYDGTNARKGKVCKQVSAEEDSDILVVHPHIDDRLKNEGASESKQT